MKRTLNIEKILQAVDTGNTTYLSRILHNLNVNRPVWGKLPVLAYATYRCRFAVVKELFSIGADVNCGRNGHTPLLIAAAAGNEPLVRLLLGAGANPNRGIERTEADLEGGTTAFMLAAAAGSKKVMELLVEAGAKTDVQTVSGLTSVGMAALAGRSGHAKRLLRLGHKPGTWTLLRAVAENDLHFARNALLNGADPNWAAPKYWAWVLTGETPLGLAVRQRSFAIIQALLNAGAKPDLLSASRTPLDWAAYDGSTRVLSALLAGGADPNIANRFGTTPLLTAAAEGHGSAVRFLLRAGADKSARLITGETAKYWATTRGHADIARLL